MVLRARFKIILLLFLTMTFVHCTSSTTASNTQVVYLKLKQAPAMPSFCAKPPEQGRLLLLFASQWCDPCHALMDKLQHHSTFLNERKITPVLVWTDTKNCLKAKMAGAHYPAWPFGRPTQIQQQEWSVSATPVIYLLQQKKPILRVDGDTSVTHLFAAIEKALQHSSES